MADNCIIWDKAINSSGYGVLWKDGRQEYAHRAAINAKKGAVVMHTCDNKKCVNPNHLRIGTHKENSKDMVDKGRQAKGMDTNHTRLSEADVFIIKDLKGNSSSRQVAKAFNISKTNVLDIWKNKIWKHLNG